MAEIINFPVKDDDDYGYDYAADLASELLEVAERHSGMDPDTFMTRFLMESLACQLGIFETDEAIDEQLAKLRIMALKDRDEAGGP